MIVKSDIGHLPPTLRSQFINGVGRSHPLWRIANQGLAIGDLDKRIEFHACMANTGTAERAFKLNLADTEPLAVRISTLAETHKLSKTRVFEILVQLGWESLQAYGAQIGSMPVTSHASSPIQTLNASVQQQATAQTLPPAAPATTAAVVADEKPKEPEFCDTPEFANIAQNMLAQFGLDVGISATATQ
jgi:hypothetical protein